MFYSFGVFVARIFNLNITSHLGASIVFFVQDLTKITILLLLMMSVMTFVRGHLPMDKIRNFISKMPFGIAHFFAAILGALTPFCSCSSLPLFFTFLKSGIPTGATFSFLITSPLVNEVAIILLWGVFGFKFMLFWLITAIAAGTILGMIFEFWRVERFLRPEFSTDKNEEFINLKGLKFLDKLKIVWHEGFNLTKKVIWFVIIGIGIGALIHGFLPENFFVEKITADNIWAVPLATILAVPLYANASGVIPIVESLVGKGIPLGTALAFMMATVGLSLPEAFILSKAMQPKLLIIFFGSVAISIIGIGFLANTIF